MDETTMKLVKLGREMITQAEENKVFAKMMQSGILVSLPAIDSQLSELHGVYRVLKT